MIQRSELTPTWVELVSAAQDELQEYLESRFEGHEKALDNLITEVQLVQEKPWLQLGGLEHTRSDSLYTQGMV